MRSGETEPRISEDDLPEMDITLVLRLNLNMKGMATIYLRLLPPNGKVTVRREDAVEACKKPPVKSFLLDNVINVS